MRLTIILIFVLALLGYGGWSYYKDTQTRIMALQDTNAKLNVAVDEQKQAIDTLNKHADEQAAQLQELQTGLNQANNDKQQLEKTLRDHDLAALARNNPKLLEDKMNRATNRTWRDLETTTGAVPLPPVKPSSKPKKQEDANGTAQ